MEIEEQKGTENAAKDESPKQPGSVKPPPNIIEEGKSLVQMLLFCFSILISFITKVILF